MREKRWQKLCRNYFKLYDAEPLLYQQSCLLNLKNKRTINRIVGKTFEEIDSFSELIFIFKKIKKTWASQIDMANTYAFSKCLDLAPNITHFKILFQSAWFFQSVLTFWWTRVTSDSLCRDGRLINYVYQKLEGALTY